MTLTISVTEDINVPTKSVYVMTLSSWFVFSILWLYVSKKWITFSLLSKFLG